MVNYLKKMEYVIDSNKLCKSDYCEIYRIRNKNLPNDILISKIYRDQNNHYYINERQILQTLTQAQNNEHIVKLKLEQINLIIDNDIFGHNPAYLICEYLPHQNLVKYLKEGEMKTQITEDMVKCFGYKLAKAIRTIHQNRITHNKLDIEMIMLDTHFDPVIIHFSEGTMNINEITNNKVDLMGFAKILAKLITNGKFIDYKIKTKNSKRYLYLCDNAKNEKCPKKFWIPFGDSISQEFKDFFNLLFKHEYINFNEILNHSWFHGIHADANLENETRRYFSKIYEAHILTEEEVSTEKYDYSNVIMTDNKCNEDTSLFSKFKHDMKSESCQSIFNTFSELPIRQTQFEFRGMISEYLLIELSNYTNNNNDFLIQIISKLYSEFSEIKEIDDFIVSVEPAQTEENPYLSFDINLNKKNENDNDNENIICNEEEFDDEDCIISDDIEEGFEENEQAIMLNLELIQFIDNNKNINKKDFYKDKFYLVFNYKQGEISFYYRFVKIFKEKAKSILKSFFKGS